MKFKDFLKLAGVYAAIFVIVTVLYVVMFGTPIFGGMDVFFYRGIALLLLAGAIAGGLGWAAKRFLLPKTMVWRDIVLIVVAFVCVHMVFFTHVPVTGERAVSVFVLGTMAQEPDRIFTEEDIERIFIETYVGEYRAFEKRFHEQVVTGTIRAEGDGYIITDRGRNLIGIYDFIADCFHIDKKLIYPEVVE